MYHVGQKLLDTVDCEERRATYPHVCEVHQDADVEFGRWRVAREAGWLAKERIAHLGVLRRATEPSFASSMMRVTLPQE